MIVIVCGIPGSGKTTLATGIRERLTGQGYAFELLHSDDYSRRPYDRMYEDVAAAADGRGGNVDGGPHWILDGTFYRRKWRNRFYRLDQVYEVWVKASLETCLARNRERTDPIPETGLRAIRGQFEPPRADLEIDTEELPLEAALDRFERTVLAWLDTP